MTYRYLDSGNDLRAGALLALGLFKFQFILPIAILISLRQSRRFTTGFIAAAASLGLLSLLMVGQSGTHDFFELIRGASSSIGRGINAQQTLGLFPSGMPNLTGLVYFCGGHNIQSPAVFNALVLCLSLGVFAWYALVVRRVEFKTAFAIAILCALLVSYHLFIYDLTLMLLPVALLYDQIPRSFLVTLFVLPVVLLHFGPSSYVLMAAPEIAIFAYAMISALKSRAATPVAA